PTILVHVPPYGHVGVDVALQAQAAGHRVECAIVAVLQEIQRLAPAADEDVDGPVIVEIGGAGPELEVADPLRHQVAAHAGGDGLVPEGAVAIVDEQAVQGAEPDDVDVQEAVLIEIGEGHAVAVADVGDGGLAGGGGGPEQRGCGGGNDGYPHARNITKPSAPEGRRGDGAFELKSPEDSQSPKDSQGRLGPSGPPAGGPGFRRDAPVSTAI